MVSGSKEGAMTTSISRLIELAKAVRTTAEEREQQRLSFAYGNTTFENGLITRDMVVRQAEAIRRESNQ